MRAPGRRPSVLVSLAAAAVLLLAGCAGSGGEQPQAEQATAESATPSASAPAEATGESPRGAESSEDADSGGSADVETEDDALEIEVEIEDGQVTPSGQRVDAAVGQRVRFVVSSDSADELHVHSTPEHTFAFRAGADDRTFSFRADRPGVVEVELHELGDVVVTIAVRP